MAKVKPNETRERLYDAIVNSLAVTEINEFPAGTVVGRHPEGLVFEQVDNDGVATQFVVKVILKKAPIDEAEVDEYKTYDEQTAEFTAEKAARDSKKKAKKEKAEPEVEVETEDSEEF